MAYLKAKQFTSWSYSRFSDWRKCPARAKYKHLDKLPEPKNEAMSRGSDIHTMAENFVLGKVARMPKELKPMEGEFKRIKDIYKGKKLPVVVEEQWAFTAKWEETEWNNWTDCWVRIKLDLAHYEDEETVLITDWKTGKYREEQTGDYMEQLDLYNLAALLKFPRATYIGSRLGYIDLGLVYPAPDETMFVTRDDLPKLKKQWGDRVKPMLADKTFKPRPTNACRWCPFSASKGGPCKY